MAEKNSNIQEAYNELDRLSADEKKRLEYEARQKAIRDKNILLKTGETRGIEKGTQATFELDKISSITGILISIPESHRQSVRLRQLPWLPADRSARSVHGRHGL